MFCFKCGGAMSDDASSCPSCGASAPMIQAIAPPQPGQASAPTAYAAAAAVPQIVSMQPQTLVAPTEDKAVISMVLGILSLVSFSILAGIPAIILGKMSRDNIRANPGRYSGEGMATAGVVMGWISVGLLCGIVVVIIIVIVIAAMAASTH
ncbi:MAG TPA: DUF4190 domain-containing protein [Candidatus Angelobacter sp.]